ncbi:MAG: hypothetical protein JWP44_2606 [Mucilaginibacter sp.]|nr:hypothetical protein [Mucilaginibacter sp.]
MDIYATCLVTKTGFQNLYQKAKSGNYPEYCKS